MQMEEVELTIISEPSRNVINHYDHSYAGFEANLNDNSLEKWCALCLTNVNTKHIFVDRTVDFNARI